MLVKEILVFAKAFKPALGRTRLPTQWVQGLLSGLMRPGLETDHSHPSSVQVKNDYELYIHCPICLLSMDKDNFIFT